MKAEDSSKVRKPSLSLWIVALPLLLFAALIGWPILGTMASNYWHRKDFDAKLWRSQVGNINEGLWPARLCMIDDLMDSGTLEGLTRKQVIDLLGTAHDKGFPGGAISCDIHYYLGPERGALRMDSEWLFINFDDHNKVERYWIYRD